MLWFENEIIDKMGEKWLNKEASHRFYIAYQDSLKPEMANVLFGLAWAEKVVKAKPPTEDMYTRILLSHRPSATGVLAEKESYDLLKNMDKILGKNVSKEEEVHYCNIYFQQFFHKDFDEQDFHKYIEAKKTAEYLERNNFDDKFVSNCFFEINDLPSLYGLVSFAISQRENAVDERKHSANIKHLGEIITAVMRKLCLHLAEGQEARELSQFLTYLKDIAQKYDNAALNNALTQISSDFVDAPFDQLIEATQNGKSIMSLDPKAYPIAYEAKKYVDSGKAEESEEWLRELIYKTCEKMGYSENVEALITRVVKYLPTQKENEFYTSYHVDEEQVSSIIQDYLYLPEHLVEGDGITKLFQAEQDSINGLSKQPYFSAGKYVYKLVDYLEKMCHTTKLTVDEPLLLSPVAQAIVDAIRIKPDFQDEIFKRMTNTFLIDKSLVKPLLHMLSTGDPTNFQQALQQYANGKNNEAALNAFWLMPLGNAVKDIVCTPDFMDAIYKVNDTRKYIEPLLSDSIALGIPYQSIKLYVDYVANDHMSLDGWLNDIDLNTLIVLHNQYRSYEALPAAIDQLISKRIQTEGMDLSEESKVNSSKKA